MKDRTKFRTENKMLKGELTKYKEELAQKNKLIQKLEDDVIEYEIKVIEIGEKLARFAKEK